MMMMWQLVVSKRRTLIYTAAFAAASIVVGCRGLVFR